MWVYPYPSLYCGCYSLLYNQSWYPMIKFMTKCPKPYVPNLVHCRELKLQLLNFSDFQALKLYFHQAVGIYIQIHRELVLNFYTKYIIQGNFSNFFFVYILKRSLLKCKTHLDWTILIKLVFLYYIIWNLTKFDYRYPIQSSFFFDPAFKLH